jgi:uncharacterized protein
MKTLFVWGGWEGHEPEQTTHLFAGLLEAEGHQVEVVNTLDVFLDSERLAGFDLIVPNWTMGSISDDQVKGLLAAVANGAGVGGWHGGMGDAFRQNTDFQFMVGGQFVAHPGGKRSYMVQITDHEHPITMGLGHFAMHSEQYYMHVDPSNHVLATTSFDDTVHGWIDGTVIPVVWTRQWGQGQVFYCSLGHSLTDFDVPEAQEIIRRGLLWASREDR